MNITNVENTAVLFVFFLAAGYIAGRTGLLKKDAQNGLTNLILYITLPCQIVDSFLLDFTPSMLRSWGLMLGLGLASQALNQLFSHICYRNEPTARRSIFRYATIVSNSGMLGMAVIASLFGNAALSYGALYLIPQRIAMWTTGVAAFTREKQKYALLKTLIHPCMVAVYVGFVVLAIGAGFPEAVRVPMKTLGDCTSPLCMVLIGAIFTEINKSMLLDKSIFFFSIIRLIAIPGILFVLCRVFGVTPFLTQICVMMTAMPAGATTGLLALRYGADETLASATVVLSTLLFFCLLPLWVQAFAL